MGFWPDVRRIVAALPDTAARQTLLFSATMPEEVMKLADEVVCDAKYVQIGIDGGPAKSITHTIENVAGGAEDRVAGEVPAPHRRSGAGVRADQVRRRAAGAQARRVRPEGGGAARRSHAGAADAGGRRIPQRPLTACSSRPTSPRAASTSTASRTSSTTKCRRTARPTCTASGRTGRADATGTALTLVAPEELRALQALQRSFGIEMQG